MPSLSKSFLPVPSTLFRKRFWGSSILQPVSRAIRHYSRRRDTIHFVALCAIAIVFMSTTIFVFTWRMRRSVNEVNSDTILGYTGIGTPIIAFPQPFGISSDVMRLSFTRVKHVLRGGSRLDMKLLAKSVDNEHLHGALIGHYPHSRRSQWHPVPFDFSSETIEMKRVAHSHASFNKVRAASLPLDRPLPDVRSTSCWRQWYYTRSDSAPWSTLHTALDHSDSNNNNTLTSFERSHIKQLPTASIIIIFHNELLVTLLRSIHSVLNRSPPEFLHQIILVDDGSDDTAPWLQDSNELEQHLQLLPKTLLVRLKYRNGLMSARNVGASFATAQVIIFLDSHIEVSEGWLEPLLGRIAEGMSDGSNHVVVPAIDNIDADTFRYQRGGIDILGHTWGLGQTGIADYYDPQSPEPMKTPVMAGGLVAISRSFFDQLGFYDTQMQYWGGEEMELSFRIWLCGGTLECLPCSRVGHVFRSDKFWQGQVYPVPGEAVSRNRQRAAFWLGDYAGLAKLSMAPLTGNQSIGSMDFYEQIRSRLQCKPFRWYLEHVNRALLQSSRRILGDGIPNGDVKSLFQAHGFLRNPSSKTCLDTLHLQRPGAVYGVFPCHYLMGSQSAVFSRSGRIMSGDKLDNGCLTRAPDGRLRQMKCLDELDGQQTWNVERIARDDMDNNNAAKNQNQPETSLQPIKLTLDGLCLTVERKEEVERKSPYVLAMRPCSDEYLLSQTWEWQHGQTNNTSPSESR